MASSSNPAITGRCLCGDIRYVCTGPPIDVAYCHRESCRRHSSAPVALFVTVAVEALRFTQGMPTAYVSSPGVTRTHCGRCGSPIAYHAASSPDRIDLYAGTLNEPAAIVPEYHIHAAEQLAWFEVADSLPRHAHGSIDVPPIRRGPRQRLG